MPVWKGCFLLHHHSNLPSGNFHHFKLCFLNYNIVTVW
nr:MAG TPA: protein of unknown function (DUF4193) [Caudoviricetes sp.]